MRVETESWKRDPQDYHLDATFLETEKHHAGKVARSREATQSHSSTGGQAHFGIIGTLWILCQCGIRSKIPAERYISL